MAEGQLAQTYMMDASDAEHARLITLARRSGDMVRELCERAGVGAGARMIDVGCGPIGALLDLAEVVGPGGSVVGLDSSDGAVASARAIVAGEGLSNVHLVHGDINAMDVDPLIADGRFDAAYTRFFLVHQPDPLATLRRIAALVRPGGRVLVHDLIEEPRCARVSGSYPRHPPRGSPWHRRLGARDRRRDRGAHGSARCCRRGRDAEHARPAGHDVYRRGAVDVLARVLDPHALHGQTI